MSRAPDFGRCRRNRRLPHHRLPHHPRHHRPCQLRHFCGQRMPHKRSALAGAPITRSCGTPSADGQRCAMAARAAQRHRHRTATGAAPPIPTSGTPNARGTPAWDAHHAKVMGAHRAATGAAPSIPTSGTPNARGPPAWDALHVPFRCRRRHLPMRQDGVLCLPLSRWATGARARPYSSQTTLETSSTAAGLARKGPGAVSTPTGCRRAGATSPPLATPSPLASWAAP